VADLAPRRDAATASRDHLATAILVATFLLAPIVQSAGFVRSDWMLGDLAYHRGVAYSMLGGDLQGQGPLDGLLSYYGGLFPMGAALGSWLTSASFDEVISVVSWPATLLLPAALLLLGRRLWPQDRFAVAMFVLIGSLAGPLTIDVAELWVLGVLPSSTSFWPIYPRDIGIALVCLALWATLSTDTRVRIVGLGAIAGVAALIHIQMALLLGWFAAVNALIGSFRRRSWRPIGELAAAGLVAVAVASWWLVPRVAAAIASGGLLIADYPGRLAGSVNPVTLIIAFGCAGILAAIALIRARHILDVWPQLGILFVWILAFIPLVVAFRLAPDVDAVTERRLWLVSSVGIVGLAAAAAMDLTRRRPGRWLPRLLAVVVVASSVPSTAATIVHLRSLTSPGGAWHPQDLGALTGLDVGSWTTAMDDLNRSVRDGERPSVMATDSAAVWTWSFSGASVFSLWLPGPFKLGFDPAVMTGIGYLERVGRLEDAYDGGSVGVCDLAAEQQMSHILVESMDGKVVTHDRTVASPYRVEPSARNLASIDRIVGPGIRYRDLGAQDVLELSPSAVVELPWEDTEIDRIGLRIVETSTSGDVLATIAVGDGVEEIEATGAVGPRWVYVDAPAGVRSVRLDVRSPFILSRMVGLTMAPDLALPTTGFTSMSIDRYCDVMAGTT